MMIHVVSAADVFEAARGALGLTDRNGDPDDSYLAFSLRRLAGFLCPCSPRTLVRSMLESHRGLVADQSDFAEKVEQVIEALVAVGDLLELGDVALEGEQVRGTWLVAAPPTFVIRESGTAILLGLASDEQTPLPTEMRSRVITDRALRFIKPHPGEDLGQTLREFGLRELSSATWMKVPRHASASELVASYRNRLSACTRAGEVSDLLVLDGLRPTRRYRARWTTPNSLSGEFVVRRPQMYGADLWGFATLLDGRPQRILDLPLQGDRWRGCDAAWRIQMAMDALSGRPQSYRLVETSNACRFDFFSPVPAWARRRLATIGEEVDGEGCLMSFRVNTAEAEAEERFLGEILYLSRLKEGGE